MARRNLTRKPPEVQTPALTSLLDIVTIVLVYFIKSFVVNPINVQDPSVDLPKSTSKAIINQAVVVMVTGKHRRDIVENDAVEETAEVPTISVDEELILHLDAKTYRVPDNLKERQFVIKPLKAKLLESKKIQQQTQAILEEAQGAAPEGAAPKTGNKIIIVADKDTPYRVLTDVMVTSGEAGFDEFIFVVVATPAD